MSRPWILGIVCCLLFASSAAVGWSQEYLDLPDEPTDQSTSLTEKFLSLTDKFRRKPRQTASETESSSQRSNPSTPRYRNTAQSSLQAQQRARRYASYNTNNAARNQTPVEPKARTQPRTQPRTQSAQQGASSGIVSRPNNSDLLPDTKLFSRGSQPLPQQLSRESKQLKPATTLPRAETLTRAGSINTKSEESRVARLSPATSRANELDAALADLLSTKPTVKSTTTAPLLKPSITKSTNTKSSGKPSQPAAPAASNTFDLRQALLDDEGDSIADAVANAAEKAIEEKAEIQAAEQVVQQPGPKVVAKTTIDDAIKAAPQGIAKPTTVKTEQPVVVATPKPATKPVASVDRVVAEPVVSKPSVIEPRIIESPTAEAISIATPRSSPALSKSTSSKFGNDPFESSSTQTYNTAQGASNPMRAFQPEFEQAKPADTFIRPDRGVLQTTQQPVIVSRVEGPRSILVGHEATYQVTLENTSTSAASNLSAEITVPEWAELVDAMSTSGVVERNSEGANAGALEWKLSALEARSSQALRLRLIPRSGRPLHLGVRWTQAAVQSQAVVEVQEPKLELAISGPQEVRYGKPQRYRLTLRNPGTGTTEQVSLRLIPPGGDEHSVTTQKIGNLEAGEVRDIDLELTARDAGELLIQADAVADGGLKAEATKTVLCRKPELKVDWRGPDKKYAGTIAAYYFRVSNPGTAATDPVDMSVKLPVGTEFVSASEGFSINTKTGVISWSLASLDASEEQFVQLRCKIARAGMNDFEVTAKTADNDLTDSKAFQTDVVALADLKLEVRDPQGPLPMGESVVYEIRVRNRGTTGAEHINIVGLFSEGIDPTTVEGAQYSLRDGRVSFHPIKSLPAGREVVLRIHAKATQVGTHVFRTEVTCPKLDIKLAAEETTRFFEDEHRWEDGQTPYMAERESTTNR